MYSSDEYNKLRIKYGPYASWAIWDLQDEGDTSIIDKSINELHSKYILLGLNISGPLERKSWLNFHGGSIHDRKLKYACNDTILRGSYMTDIFKGIEEVQASQLDKLLTTDIINDNVGRYNQEMKDIKITDDSQFLIFGNHAAQYFNRFFKQGFNNKIISHTHYSYYGSTDKIWVENLWKKLNIINNFDNTLIKYK